jgi:cytochrome c nitrite reductase small subunit
LQLAPALAAATCGILMGIAVVGFDYAEGLSYLSTDPKACAHCHIMQSQYDSWQKASHHAAATCVGCHLPDAFVPKYLAKARNGWNHSSAFTMQNFPEPIMITEPNAKILQANCLRCHGSMVHDISAASGAPLCVTCHDSVGHGELVGLGGPLRAQETTIHE